MLQASVTWSLPLGVDLNWQSLIDCSDMERLTNFRADDVVTDVLKSVAFRSVIFCRSELRAPWAFSVAGRNVAGFHVVTRGRCWLRVGKSDDVTELRQGDLVILTQGAEHSVADNPKTPPTRLDLLLEKQPVDKTNTFRAGGDGPVTELVCGGFFLSDGTVNPLIASLPDVIHIRSRDHRAAPWLRATLALIADEIKAGRPGAEHVVVRLSDILFVQAVRAFLAAKSGQSVGWMRGLKDPRVGLAIDMIHRQPELHWTVLSLAERVGMSRSVFADRFQSLVGESPLQYLTRWRLGRAATLLRTTAAKLPEIADRVGYESEFAFSRAFKRVSGLSPSDFRKSASNGSDERQ